MPLFKDSGAAEQKGIDPREYVGKPLVIHSLSKHKSTKGKQEGFYYNLQLVELAGTIEAPEAYAHMCNVAGAYIVNQLDRVNVLTDLPLGCTFVINYDGKPFPSKDGPLYPVMIGDAGLTPEHEQLIMAYIAAYEDAKRLATTGATGLITEGQQPNDYGPQPVDDIPMPTDDDFPF